ncbi:MAG TPA: BACON domain-containing carbohydrate-binding protein [Thermoanaerobaculia bacterium]|nr:BACON domain-containing carbohydrate-binding protein [Thermoanaerobaculia bacterium]
MRLSAAFAAVLILVSVIPQAAGASEVPLIPAHADWRYLDDGSNEETYWREPLYDDSWWDSGPAELGYGDGTERTVVASGPAGNFHPTTYFRRSFDVYDPSVFTDLTVRLLRDDGAVVYLNGTEVWRTNMPSGAIDYRTYATNSVGGPDEETFFSHAIDESLLVAGTNVVAVEIHQVDNSSSDISFNLELIGTSNVDIVTLTRGPYLQTGTPESVRVRWRTNSPSDSRVRFGPSPGNLNTVVDSGTAVTEHNLLLSGLSPSTRYYYSVGSSTQTLAGDASHNFVTSSFTGSTDPMRIWVLGDSGTADYSASSVRDAYLDYTGSTRTNLWLMLGDNAYDTGTDSEFQAAVFEMYPQMLKQSVLWPTIGNHDTAQSANPPANLPYFNVFTLPTSGEAGGTASGTEKYYSFDYGNVHFICLDSMTSNRSSSGPMLTWLRNDLESTSQQWVVAFWHHPPYSKGSHDSDQSIFLYEMRQNAVPILEEYGVDLVLSGHSHSYERSFLIDSHYGNSNTLTSSMKKDGGSGRVDGTGPYKKGTLGPGPHEGAVYVVAGSSGQVTPAPLNHPAMYIGMANLGSLVIDVQNGRMDVKFLRETGVIADWFTIVKGSPSAPSSLTATAASATRVNLQWTDTAINETGFRIERCSGTACSDFAQIAETAVNAVTYADMTVTAGTVYRYHVSAYNSGGSSAYSNTAQATTPGGAPCTYTVAPASFSFPAVASTGNVSVTTMAPCSWTATTTTPWITVTAGAGGTGSGTATFNVTANDGVARSGSITVAGTVIPVSQDCAQPAISGQPQSATVVAGEPATLSVTATGAAPLSYQWFAGPTAIDGATGTSLTVTPSATTTYKVRVTNSCGTIDSAEATVTVQPCSYSVTPTAFSFPPAEGTGSVSIATTSTCSWSASTSTSWITLTGGTGGTGNGTTTFTVAANGGAARNGSVTVAGVVIPVAQACTGLSISSQPQSATVIAGEPATLTVTATGAAPLSYQWFAGSTAIDGATGTSLTVTPSATTTYKVRVTDSCSTIDSAEATVTVQPCSFSVAPASFAFPPADGTGSVTVTTTSTCSWSAITSTSWITITGGDGTGNGTATFTVAANGGAARSGSITVAGTLIAITQGCEAPAVTAQPQPATIVSGESATLSVTATGAAPLTYEWYAGTTRISGATGSSLTVTPASTTAYRARVISACGEIDSAEATVTVQPCSYSVTPESFAFSSAAGEGNVTVTTTGTCSWTASTSTPWITVTEGASGTGSATATFAVAANSGAARSGSITVAGIVIPVTQACTLPAITEQPQSGSITIGESTTLEVTATSPTVLSYQWYAGSTPIDGADESWLTVTPSSTTTYTVQVTNACGSVGSAEATVTVEQCAYEVSPTSFDFDSTFNTGVVTVVAPHVCSWTAATTTPWITITENASGNGDDVVIFDVEINNGAARSGSVTVAGVIIPVMQACKPTAIAEQPQSTTITAGGSTTLRVTASGPAPLSYQWFAGSTLIGGQTGSSLTVSPSSTTTYRVRVTSACTSVDSAEATVTVQPCTYSPSPSSFTFLSGAASSSVQIITQGTCSWSAATTTPWMTLTGGLSGTGNGTTTFTIAANGGEARSGSITIGGVVIPVTQAAPPCDPAGIATQPQSTTVVAGGSATLSVTASGTGPFSYQWYTGLSGVTSSPISGATTGSVTVTPSADTRYWVLVTNACGSVESAAALVTVAPCSWSVAPGSFSFGANGGSGTITVTAASTCAWTAATNDAWITITEGFSDSGDGQTSFTIAPNSGTEPRSGSIAVAGEIVTIAQSEPVAEGAPPAPTGVNARAYPTRVTISWNAVSGATSYQVERRAAGGGYVTVGSTTVNWLHDSSAASGEAYLYRVRALNGTISSAVSASDLVTTILFTDSPLAAGNTIRAIHLAELRTAVDAVRRLAGLGAGSYTGQAIAGTTISAMHILELRTALDQARALLGLPTGDYVYAIAPGVRVRAFHFNELRGKVS